jgi:hypothetical protein
MEAHYVGAADDLNEEFTIIQARWNRFVSDLRLKIEEHKQHVEDILNRLPS